MLKVRRNVLYSAGEPQESEPVIYNPDKSSRTTDDLNQLFEKIGLCPNHVAWYKSAGELLKQGWQGMTRTIAKIPESGADGEFYAQFRNDVIQWRSHTQRASNGAVEAMQSMLRYKDDKKPKIKHLSKEDYTVLKKPVYYDLREEVAYQERDGALEADYQTT